MNKASISFWIPTGLLLFGLLSGGIFNLTGSEQVLASLNHLGYPPILAKILGTWKLLGAVAIAAPGLQRAKEWAYAGAAFTFTGATISHLAAGDGLGGSIAPLVLLAAAGASWALRPASRRLAGPLL